MSSINFDNVYLLFIAIPLVVLFAVPFFLAVRKDNANGHNIASGIMHLVMALLIAFTAAGTKIITTVTETNVYVVADVSYSASKNLDKVDEYIGNIKDALPRNSRMGVICFGKNYRLMTRLGENIGSVKEAVNQNIVDTSETNIVEALDYAGTLFREGVIKRVVVITDGKQSYEGDSNALKRSVDALVAKNIQVDAMFLDDNIGDGVREVQISEVEFVQNVYKGHRETANAIIRSTYDVQAIVTLYKGEESVAVKTASLSKGTNSVSFAELDTSESGTFDYEIRVTADGDESSYNNSFYFTQTVSDSLNVLLITGSTADSATVREMYGRGVTVDAYINRSEVPGSVEALCEYDEIVISNFDLLRLTNYEKFIESLDTAVSLFGKSLITFGNTGIQDCENNELRTLDKMLPVNYGNNNQDSKLFTLVIDNSRSMFMLDKLDRAKLAACKLLDLLSDDDNVCVVAFNGDFMPVHGVTSVGASRDIIKEEIQNLGVAQGTLLDVGLREAYKLIKDLPFNEKQVMLLSDGLTFDSGSGVDDDPVSIVANMRYNGISTSVIDVGRGNNTDETSMAAAELLGRLAAEGNGKYYLAKTESDINDVIIGDINSDLNETVIERSSFVKVSKRRDELVSGLVDAIEASYVNGYYNSAAKASATTVLTVDYYKADAVAVQVPLFAYTKYGNGKTASFTSTINGNWVSNWKRADGVFTGFFDRVIESVVPEEKVVTPYISDIIKGNSYSVIEITPASIRPDANATIQVLLPDGEEINGDMRFDSNIYSYSFATPDVGKYTVNITYSYAGTDYVSTLMFNVPHLAEYDAFAIFEASGLYKMLGSNGKVSENGKIELVNDESRVGLYTIDCTIPMLIICVALFAIDIIVRKLKWEDIRSLFKKVNK